MTAVELFRTADVAVRHWQGFSRDCCFVTFDSFTDFRSLDRPGFAEHFLGENGIDAVHVLSRENDWYQYPDMLSICERVRTLTEGYDRVVAYGSSMGAYAAIRFGRLVGASTAFALSPQFSIDPLVVPFENRWNHDAGRIRLLHEADPPPFVERAILVYDKHDPDARHAALYRDRIACVDIALLNCAHPSTGYLAELKLLQDCVRAIARGEFDPEWLRREARSRRKQAGQFYFALAQRVHAPRCRLRLMEIATAKAPGNFNYLAHLATIAAEDGRYDDAMEVLERGTALAPGHPVMRFNRSRVLELKGDYDGAIDIMTSLARESGLYQHRLDNLRVQLHRADAASWTQPVAAAPPQTDPPPRGWTRHEAPFQRARRAVAARVFRTLRGHGVPPYGRRQVLPEIERAATDLRVTTFPSPPPFALSWRTHDRLVRAVPRDPVDLLILGDSLAEYWPEEIWAPWRVFNFGVAADKVQHVIWRLDEVTRKITAKRALILVGTNNLGAADTPEGIVAGIREMLGRLALVAPGAEPLVLEIPPVGPEFEFRAEDRMRANELLRAAGIARTLNADAALLEGGLGENPYYQPDHIHFSIEGYQLLARLAREAWNSAMGRDSKLLLADAGGEAGAGDGIPELDHVQSHADAASDR